MLFDKSYKHYSLELKSLFADYRSQQVKIEKIMRRLDQMTANAKELNAVLGILYFLREIAKTPQKALEYSPPKEKPTLSEID